MVISSIIFHLISWTGLFGLSVYGATWPEYGTLKTTNSSGIMNVTINNTFSTINLFDFHFQSDLANLIETLQSNNSGIKVVIFSSGNKDFFLSHADISSFLPTHGESFSNF
jgi:enoyl-CoA hydratase/carnithine racemase